MPRIRPSVIMRVDADEGSRLNSSIVQVEEDIKQVEAKVEKIEAQIERMQTVLEGKNLSLDEIATHPAIVQLREKENKLRDEKKQLREKENKLLDRLALLEDGTAVKAVRVPSAPGPAQTHPCHRATAHAVGDVVSMSHR